MKLSRLLSVLFFAALLALGCASPGSPDGGPYDETPPMVVGSTPKYGNLNTKSKKVEIYFNEFIKVENASEKVVVSPPQLNQPEITGLGKKIKVSLQDSLKDNTTYTIDFSDAIVDNNEGNPLGHYTFVFSTGNTTDTMEVAGKVLDARNLEPVKGILVGLHSDTTDSAFLKRPFVRVARTNGSGEFIIKGVAPGRYRAYALEDADGDFTFSQKSERIAFLPKVFETGSYPDVRPDTVWHDSIHIDSIRIVHFTHYTPDNLVLMAFLESHQERHLLKTERPVPEHFDVYFTAPSTEIPKLKGLNFDEKDAIALVRTQGNDTLSYWLKDTALVHQDTLLATYTYLETDTTGQLAERTDTISFVSKISRAKQLKLQAEQEKKWKKEQERLKKKNQPYQTRMPVAPFELKLTGTTTIAPDENLTLVGKEPIASIDTTKIHLQLRIDSTYHEAGYLLKPHPLSLFRATLYAEWRPRQEYQLVIDSAAFINIYGQASNAQKYNISVPSLDTYASLFLNLKGVEDTMAVVELLSSADKPLRSVRSKDGRAEFYFLKPGSYYVRLFIDRNGNGKWDSGDYESGTLPEETYYYPHKLNLRALWDVEQDWDIRAVPIIRQKPLEITKQKPDKKKTIQNRNAQRERDKNR